MSLKTDTFGFTRHWLVTALKEVPLHADILAKKNISTARRAFLAGSNQLVAIKNWLSHAGVVDTKKGAVTLTDLGRLMAAKDPSAEQAWTWWVFHLTLCANPDSFPYSAFFTSFDAAGTTWVSLKDIIDKLHQNQPDPANPVEWSTVESYFQGVERTLRPGHPLHTLGLVERRSTSDERERFRRKLANPADLSVAYAALLFHDRHFPKDQTVETRLLLEKGLARSLGVRDHQLRDALNRIHQHPDLGTYIQFRKVVNLDSVQFQRTGEPALKSLRLLGYQSGEVRWP